MARYKIVYDRHTCIGALQCTSRSEQHFGPSTDGKVTLLNGVETARDHWEVEIEEEQRELAVAAARVCPVRAIVILDAETEDVIAP